MSRTQYQLDEISGDQALAILKDLLSQLSEIDETYMTTIELSILTMCAHPKLKRWYELQKKINNGAAIKS